MKGIIKLRSSVMSIILLLVSILAGHYSDVNSSNISKYLQSDCVSVSNFINDNFDEFVDKYNENSNDDWNASYIENKFPIIIDECGEEYSGIFLDFNANNGYAVVGNEYSFLDFNIDEASPYKNIEAQLYYYCVSTGYFYETEKGLFSVNEEKNVDEDFLVATPHYEGQEKEQVGCGKIFNPYDYVNAKYGSDWTMSSERSLPMQTSYNQRDLSCYEQYVVDSNGKLWVQSEGNCWIVSAYNVLQYMQQKQWHRMPAVSSNFFYFTSTNEPSLYSAYYDSNHNNITNDVEYIDYKGNKAVVKEYQTVDGVAGRVFPVLYSPVRRYVVETFGKVNGGTPSQSHDIIEHVAGEYGYGIAFNYYDQGAKYVDKGTKRIDSGEPLIFCTDSDTYGRHSMAVCGYKYFAKTEGWWIFKQTKYLLFYELRDGHARFSRYFDMSGYEGGVRLTFLDLRDHY